MSLFIHFSICETYSTLSLLAVDGDNTIAQTRELIEILDDGPGFLDSFDAELFDELVEKVIAESNDGSASA